MKKTLTIVLALVLALSMLASFAFVLNPGTGGAIKADKNPLVITGFFATNNDEIKSGARIYAPLADKTNDAYAKNEIIRFAITMDVMNDKVPANVIDSTQFGDKNTLTVTSDTVDFSVSNMAGQQALHVPFGSGLVNAINSKLNLDAAHSGAAVVKNVMTIKVVTAQANTTPDPAEVPANADFIVGGIKLYSPVAVTEAKASYAFIFTGITKGEITEQGLAKLVTAKVDASAFDEDALETTMIKVEKNNRIYYVQKTVVPANVLHNTITTGIAADHPYYNQVAKVGYRIYLVGAETSTAGTYELLPVTQLDTESITWKDVGVDLKDTEVEGLGYSLGLEKITPTAGLTVAKSNGKFLDKVTGVPALAPANQARVFRTVLSDGTVRYILGDGTFAEIGTDAFLAAELARLNTMLADFGFSTADNYTYKLEDKYFTSAGADLDVLTATYNNGTVVPVEPDEEEDLEEGTPEDELEDGEEIEEDIEDDVPAETGDFASDIAIALTAAAIVAAAALAFVMKKARD